MKKITAIFLFSFLLGNLAQAAETNFTIHPTTILTEEDHGVLMSVKLSCAASSCPEHVELVQWEDAAQKEVKFRWQLNDTALYGDQKAGDHIYSQQVFLKKHAPTTLYFTAAGTYQGQVQVTARPTFIEGLKQIFEKIKAEW